MGKGGGHSKGQTMPYAVVRTWGGGKPTRTPKWNIGAAEADMLDSLRAANARGAEIEIRVIDRATGEMVAEPQRCVVCRERWATETGSARGAEAPSLCRYCEDEHVDPALAAQSEPLVQALQAKGLEPVAQPDGMVTVEANGIDWTMQPVPHAVTGEPCGVWSAVGPAGPRGQFVALNAAEFVAQRRTP
ncbi:hypothetical protein [Streptomyces sp. NRRL S-455]|uniref:hypothetical protein n=1 Tax=Streptomyces sp. NRRL S-455 TaxID=1463908 RepID=UPI0004C02AAF|nr:hypothetical protein [Streptomyces sp. NRRL S-455]